MKARCAFVKVFKRLQHETWEDDPQGSQCPIDKGPQLQTLNERLHPQHG